jgi:PAS domain S-box-containing protein
MKKKNLNSYIELSQDLKPLVKPKNEPHAQKIERVPKRGLVIDTNFVIQDVDHSFLKQHKLNREDIIGHFYSDITKLTIESLPFNGIDLDHDLKIKLEDILLNNINEQLFGKILHLVLDATQSLYGLFGYLDNDKTLVCPAVTRDVWDFYKGDGTMLKLPRDIWDGLWGQALTEKRIIYSNSPFRPPNCNIKIRNSLIVPIIDHEASIGLLIVGDKEKDIDLKDRALVKNIAAFIAPILHSRLKQNFIHHSTNNMEELLRNCEERYHSIFDTAPHLITSIDSNGIIVDCNNRVLDYLGYKQEEFIGLSILNLIHPDYENKAKGFINLTFPKGTSKKDKFKMLRKDGSEIDVTITNSGFKIKSEGDKPLGNIFVIEDITDLKKPEKIAMVQKSHAEAYLDILVHDINNLNKSINTYSELLLLKPKLSSQYKKYILTTLDYSRAISDLINNIRRLANLSKNNIELKNIDVFKTLAAASDHIQQIYPLRKISIKQSISESEVIVQSSEMLKDAFLNILNNAIKFNRQDEVILEITHSLSKDKKYWKLEFKDNGPGVPDDLKNKIFNDFEIGSENIYGSGLGLAVVKDIINISNGRIWVEDRVADDYKKGSNFIILLPKGE